MPAKVRLPRLSQATTEAIVVAWFKAEGDSVDLGEPLLEVTTDKATVEIESPAAGTLVEVVAHPDATVPVGGTLCFIGAENQVSPSFQVGVAVGSGRESTFGSAGPSRVELREERRRVRATPVARKVAKELGIDLAEIQGTGPRGTITHGDVRAAADGVGEESALEPSSEPQVSPVAPGSENKVEIVPLTGVRKMMAERVALSHRNQVPVTTVAEVDMSSVQDLRKRVEATYTAFVVKAAALALRDYPSLNASLQGTEIRRFDRIHVNVAIDTERGLLVPVVRDADRKGLTTVNAEIQDLAQRGREGGLDIEEMQGGTFTITNSGVLGSLLFTPVINYPQSAILGMGKVMDTPVIRGGQVVARPMMYLCLTYDHRHIAGATAVRYLQAVKANLEDVVACLVTSEVQ